MYMYKYTKSDCVCFCRTCKMDATMAGGVSWRTESLGCLRGSHSAAN